jgi:3-hydroxyacyl-CoA dehydrogenase
MAFIDRSKVRTVGIVGAGLIGAGWASWFLARGFDVRASDTGEGREAFLRNLVAEVWPILAKLGLVKGADQKRLTFHKSPGEAATGCDFIQESVFERLDLKQEVLAKVDAVLPPDRVISSSTSSYEPSLLQAKCRHPERVIVGHPFNPPHLVPLVEVVGGKQTDPAAVDWAMAFYDGVGKKAIRLNKEIRGHYVNRVQEAMWREAVHCVAEGIVSVEDADIGIAYGPGLRWALMGPSFTFHLGGGPGGMKYFLEQMGPHIGENWQKLGNPTMTPELHEKLIEGTKTQAAGRSYQELVRWRDEKLADILKAIAKPAKP